MAADHVALLFGRFELGGHFNVLLRENAQQIAADGERNRHRVCGDPMAGHKHDLGGQVVHPKLLHHHRHHL